jgi:DNA-binding NtrC family response regulator
LLTYPAKTLLLVEACIQTQHVLKSILEQSDYVVMVARTTMEAETQIGIASPDSMLLDCDVPGTPSLDFVTSIQRRFPHIALVAIGTGNDLPARAASLGISRCMRKPFDFLAMLDIVAHSSLVNDIKVLTA